MPVLDLPSLEIADADALDDGTLIRLIMQFHDAHMRDLDAALELAERVAERHASFPAELPGLIANFLEELREHQAHEEAVLFPVILSGAGRAVSYPIAALGTDHEHAQDELERLVRLTHDFNPPPEACGSWRKLYDLCRKFDRDFRQHVQLEDRVLLARVR